MVLRKRVTVSIKVSHGRIQLAVPVDGKRQYLTLGLDDSPGNIEIARARARVIEDEIARGVFRIEDYRDRKLVEMGAIVAVDLPELWARFVAYKRPLCKQSTMANQYKGWTSFLARCPSQSLAKAVELRDWAIDRSRSDLSHDASRRWISALNACCKWGVASELIASNPFEGLLLPKAKSSDDEADVDPFTALERDRIIAALLTSRHYAHYAPYVMFSFWIGCRTSEAIALEWSDIDKGAITFRQAATKGEDGRISLSEGLKTQTKRRVNLNDRLKRLLCNSTIGIDAFYFDVERSLAKALEPEAVRIYSEILNGRDRHKYQSNRLIENSNLVFPTPNGKLMDSSNFRDRAWRWVLEECQLKYRKPYQTRHSFATICVEAGYSVVDIAKIMGNSPQVVLANYAGATRDLVAPEA
jgi:integrase